jgi:ornithine cyclodeaminase/alanine dehydrogenase-like protein (mu-crystallin family)
MLALLRSLIGIYQIMVILDHKQIEELIDLDVAGAAIEAAYIAASNGEVTLPPVGHITFPDVAGDCHIKYGHVKGDPSLSKSRQDFRTTHNQDCPQEMECL